MTRCYKQAKKKEASMFGAVERLEDGDNRTSLRRDAALDRLTRQELAVLREIALGASDAEVAQRLGLPRHAVIRHVGQIVEKLSLSDRRAAVRLAPENGLRVL
jgi:DNA-binding NarL/FixJ family response regulator